MSKAAEHFSGDSLVGRELFSTWFIGELKRIGLRESVGHCTTLATPWGRFELIFSETADEMNEACEL